MIATTSRSARITTGLGVREYVIIDRFTKQGDGPVARPGGYEERVLTPADTYSSPLLPGLEIPWPRSSPTDHPMQEDRAMATHEPEVRDVLALGPDDNGRLVSDDEFAAADFAEPWKYERVEGRLVVMYPNGPEHVRHFRALARSPGGL
jgi:Uma2 family endonuclease